MRRSAGLAYYMKRQRKLSIEYAIWPPEDPSGTEKLLGYFEAESTTAVVLLGNVAEEAGFVPRHRLTKGVERDIASTCLETDVHETLHYCLEDQAWRVEPYRRIRLWSDAAEERAIDSVCKSIVARKLVRFQARHPDIPDSSRRRPPKGRPGR